MPGILQDAVSPERFMPHGFCLQWDPPLVGTIIVANLGIALAYFAIPMALWYFTRARKDLAYSFIFRLFATFILACGLTHVMKVWTLYQPFYWLEAAIDTATALVSLLTACVLWPLIPKALSLRSPSALEEANRRLEDVNTQLTSANTALETVNQDLMIAREQALEASGLKSAFVANISHELRTPLSGILGMNELLMKTPLEPTQEALAKAVHQSAQNLLLIVNDILDVAKIEAGKLDVTIQDFDPKAIIRETLDVMQPVAKRKELPVRAEIDPELPPSLAGDPVRIRQILINLLSNAVKFTSHGEVVVRATVENQDDHLLLVKFAVSDTGIGLSEPDQKFLFLPFSQVDSSNTRRYEGTGLGLSISKRLVELMGGSIGFSSQQGEGSTFWFSLPFSRTVADIAAIHDRDSRFFSKSTYVLVVEDNLLLQQLAMKQLENLGVSGYAVDTGHAALAELSTKQFDIILMDCYLPDVDGYEVTRQIRSLESAAHSKHLPVIGMTAGAMRGDAEKCIEAGMDDYLSKPYTIEQLRQKLTQWLAKGPPKS